MSLYGTVTTNSGDNSAGDVASNSGWLDFGNFVAALNDVDELQNLTEFGWSDDGSQLADDLRKAIEQSSDVDQTDIANGLLAIANNMTDGDVLTVSDGVGVVEAGVPV